MNQVATLFQRSLAGLALLVLSAGTYADQLQSIQIEGQGELGIPVTITVNIDVANAPNANKSCGLDIQYGDGVVEEFLPGRNGPQDFPVRVTHVYAAPGNYVIKAVGKTKFRGLATAFACTGADLYAPHAVSDGAARKAQESAAAKAGELDAKEANLRKMQDELARAKQAQLQREQELDLKEKRARQAETAAIAAAAKESALKATVEQPLTPSKKAPAKPSATIDAF